MIQTTLPVQHRGSKRDETNKFNIDCDTIANNQNIGLLGGGLDFPKNKIPFESLLLIFIEHISKFFEIVF